MHIPAVHFGLSIYAMGGVALLSLILFSLFVAVAFRVVVSTNSVHIVQSASKTTSYGRGRPAGNTYYKWPTWIPGLGVRVTELPVSVFDKQLVNYAAYDIDRVPFVIDIVAFFRISDSDVAAERVHSFDELMAQLEPILQGAARTILATSSIDDILGKRDVFGVKFTDEVTKDLVSWGVEPVKSIELMDIRDAGDSKVISNIMAKKKSFIEMESRVAVAENTRKAQTAEIEAQQAVLVRKQEADEFVGVRTAQKDQEIGINTEKAKQAVKEQAKLTATKDMAVLEVQQVRSAEIARGVQLVLADQQKQTTIIAAEATKQTSVTKAEGEKQQAVLIAEGNLQTALLSAQGVEAKGKAEGAAETAKLLAPVTAQTELAQKIGENSSYQTYLISIRNIEAGQAIGVAQAGALTQADVRIIVNGNSPAEGAKSVMDLFTPKGDTQLGAAVEAVMNASDTTAAILTGAANKLNKPNGTAKPQ